MREPAISSALELSKGGVGSWERKTVVLVHRFVNMFLACLFTKAGHGVGEPGAPARRPEKGICTPGPVQLDCYLTVQMENSSTARAR